jgi:hypothetical protein
MTARKKGTTHMDKNIFVAVLQGLCANEKVGGGMSSPEYIVHVAEEIAKAATDRLNRRPEYHDDPEL